MLEHSVVYVPHNTRVLYSRDTKFITCEPFISGYSTGAVGPIRDPDLYSSCSFLVSEEYQKLEFCSQEFIFLKS